MFSRFGLCSLKREHHPVYPRHFTSLIFQDERVGLFPSFYRHPIANWRLHQRKLCPEKCDCAPISIPNSKRIWVSVFSGAEGQSSSTAWKIMLGQSRALKASPTQGTHLGYCRGWNVLSQRDTWNFMYLLLLIWRQGGCIMELVKMRSYRSTVRPHITWLASLEDDHVGNVMWQQRLSQGWIATVRNSEEAREGFSLTGFRGRMLLLTPWFLDVWTLKLWDHTSLLF